MTCVLGVAGACYKTYSVIAEDSSNIVKVKNSGVLGDVNGRWHFKFTGRKPCIKNRTRIYKNFHNFP